MPTYYQANESPEKCVTSLKKSGKLTVALVCVLLGVGLLLFGNRLVKEETDDTPDTPVPGSEIRAVEEYRIALERRVADITAEVAGAGSVSVVVTLEGGFTSVYATEYQNGNESYVIVGSGSNAKPLFLSREAPEIAGIGIVCKGGADASVRHELTVLISAAFHISSNRIYITAAA